MEPQLPRIDGREEVPADERVQAERGQREGKEHDDHHRLVFQRPVERTLVGSGQSTETGFERVGEPSEERPPDRMP